SIYIEFVLGFHTINAFTNTVEWSKPNDFEGKIGIKNLRFGEVITDITAIGDKCTVISNKPYNLKINEKNFIINRGLNEITF
ncbi:MAG: alpha,alpha-trehalase, partial [Firmicutes bacterium]|nr:alpha,alpha-trehalase [Bacillota bacterium]